VPHESTRGDDSDSNATLIPSPAGYCEEGDNGPVSFNKIMAHP